MRPLGYDGICLVVIQLKLRRQKTGDRKLNYK